MNPRTLRLLAAVPYEMSTIAQSLEDLRVKLELLSCDGIPGTRHTTCRIEKAKRYLAYTAGKLNEALWAFEERYPHLYRPEEPERTSRTPMRGNGHAH